MMITQQQLKEILDYDPNTGVFTWLCDRGGSIKTGQVAGCIDNFGYVIITMKKKSYKAHRLAWLYMNGSLPLAEIDHKNGNKLDNSIVNLRQASKRLNAQNRFKQKNNTSGKTGVMFDKRIQRWKARINGKHLGYFDDYDEAVKARERAELIYQPLRVVKC